MDLKNPEIAIKLAEYLKEKQYNFHLTMIGGGDLEKKISDMVNALSLHEHVSLLGTMSPNEVRTYMEKIRYIFIYK